MTAAPKYRVPTRCPALRNIDTWVKGFEALPPGIVPWRRGVIRALEKNVLIKRRGTWRIVQHQQTLAAPE